MADNPFEPISTGGPSSASGYTGPLDVEPIVREAWRLLMSAPLPLGLASFLAVGGGMAFGFVMAIPSAILTSMLETRLATSMDPELAESVASLAIQFGTTPINTVIGTLLAWIPMTVALDVVQGTPPSFARVFAKTDRILPFVGATVLVQIVTLLGYVALIVPGFILSIGLAYAGYFALDRNLSPVNALKASWAATDGSKVTVFVLTLATALLAGLGTLLTCGFGVLLALPWMQVVMALIYTRLSAAAVDQIPAEP